MECEQAKEAVFLWRSAMRSDWPLVAGLALCGVIVLLSWLILR